MGNLYTTVVLTSGLQKPSKHKVNSVDVTEEEGSGSTPAKMVGPLMKVKWYRVILDEAHQVSNMNLLNILESLTLSRFATETHEQPRHVGPLGLTYAGV